jgi:putative transposase
LLQTDEMKMIIIGSFQWLVQHELVHIYGYVVMDNHIHVLWEQLKMNGKETPKESFEKFTGHMFVKKLKPDIKKLEEYATEQKDRNYLFWQRDPLAILITDKKMAGEKLDYMHHNPLQPHWQLCKEPAEYRFSPSLAGVPTRHFKPALVLQKFYSVKPHTAVVWCSCRWFCSQAITNNQ